MMRGHCAAVGERLVEGLHEPIDVRHVPFAQGLLEQPGSACSRRQTRAFALIESRVFKADRARSDSAPLDARHRVHDGITIDAAGQERRERHFAHETHPRRFVEQFEHATLAFLLGHLVPLVERRLPVALRLHPLLAEETPVRRRQLVHALEDRQWVRHVTKREELRHGVGAQLTADAKRVKSLDLGRKREAAVRIGPVERLLADAIAGAEQLVTANIRKRERKHPTKARGQSRSPGSIPVQQDFCVAVGPEAMPLALEFGTQFEVVVDLAVERDDELPILGGHRLLAARDVDDRQPTMREAEAGAQVQTGTIWTAMSDRIRHRAKHGLVDRSRAIREPDPGDATHGQRPQRAGPPIPRAGAAPNDGRSRTVTFGTPPRRCSASGRRSQW